MDLFFFCLIYVFFLWGENSFGFVFFWGDKFSIDFMFFVIFFRFFILSDFCML